MPALIAAAPQLRAIARAGTGVDNVDVPAATARGIVVMNAPGANSISVAELAMAQILALARHIAGADAIGIHVESLDDDALVGGGVCDVEVVRLRAGRRDVGTELLPDRRLRPRDQVMVVADADDLQWKPLKEGIKRVFHQYFDAAVFFPQGVVGCGDEEQMSEFSDACQLPCGPQGI